MNALHVYTLLHDACRMLDDHADHAIAAYVGLAMALIEEKYGVSEDDVPAKPMPANIAAQVNRRRPGGPHA